MLGLGGSRLVPSLIRPTERLKDNSPIHDAPDSRVLSDQRPTYSR